jgi:hypothetical protein
MINRLIISFADGAPAAESLGTELCLLVFVGDLAVARAKVKVADLVRQGGARPLNLSVLLAPIFPDLEDEEHLRSLGHKHPRCDLAIPSLRVIIEIKFVLNGEQADFANVIEGVAADTSLYLSEETGFSQIVAFVWDNARCSEQHNEMLQGLRRVRGIKDAVVVSRPGGWA